jgi:flagellar biosynthesis activator protein FlaF
MRDALQTYGKVARQIASPRELEAILLLRTASQLQSIHDNWNDKRHELETALFDNRQLWLVLLTSVTSPDNPLPSEIRQNVANLGIFVINRTLSLITDSRPERLGSLITINRELAAGLLGRA